MIVIETDIVLHLSKGEPISGSFSIKHGSICSFNRGKLMFIDHFIVHYSSYYSFYYRFLYFSGIV